MIIKDIKSVLFSAKGRINRLTFWVYNIPLIAFQVLLNFAEEEMLPFFNSDNVYLILFPVIIISIWISLALGIKRCHDRDKSGWWMLLLLVPLVGPLWLLISLGFIKGTEGSNRYGSDPFVKYAN